MLKFRLYLDKDEEKEWLNKMANKGFAMTRFGMGFYTFEKCEPGEWRYEIDLLDSWSGDGRDYKEFMQENDIEVVCQWWRWVIMRKRTEDGPMILYSDAESQIEQYEKIKIFFIVGLCLELSCLVLELIAYGRTGSLSLLLIVAMIGVFVLLFCKGIWKCKWKITELKRRKN